MGNVFSDVYANATNEWLLERARIILEKERRIVPNETTFPLYLHILRPADDHDSGGDSAELGTKQSEKLTALEAQVAELKRELAARDDATRAMLGSVASKLDALLGAVRQPVQEEQQRGQQLE